MIPDAQDYPVFKKEPVRFVLFWILWPLLIIVMNIIDFVHHPIDYPKRMIGWVFRKR